MMDDLENNPDKDEAVRQLRGRRLLMAASGLGENIDALWEVYSELMTIMDMNNPAEQSLMLDIVAEFEDNLMEMLNLVEEQIYGLTGMYEPFPLDAVEDFESSVLKTIGGLDSVNLDDYRLTSED